ncbi:MAG: hypothetical protein ACSHWU_02520 [Marinicella sp.]
MMKIQFTYTFILLLVFVEGIADKDSTPLQPLCGLNSQAQELAELIIQLPEQQRQLLVCNDELVKIAQQRAEQLARNNHDPDISPNQVVIKGGFRFPSYYPISGNQVEAVAKNQATAKEALAYLTSSDSHQDHILGKGEFFGLQSQLAVGYFSDDDVLSHDQWVVLIAEPYQTPKIVYKQEFNMPFRLAKGCEKDWKNSSSDYLKKKCSSMMSPRSPKLVRVNKQDDQLDCNENSCELAKE